MVKKRREKYTIEVLLAFTITILLLASLVFKQLTTKLIPYSIEILLFVLISFKITKIIRKKGTVFEDFLSIVLLTIFFILRFITIKNEINAAIVIVGILSVLYSVGIIPSIKRISKSKNVTTFILSYFIVMLSIIFLFTGTYMLDSTEFTEGHDRTTIDFPQAFYFSTMTFTTVGYGDISPLGTNRLVSSIEALIGIMLNIGLIGYILASRRFRHNK